jgi:hypothetical protein
MTEVVPLLVRALAVAGGAALGWVAIGFLVSMLRRFLGVSSVPRPPLLVARALGAVVAGCLIWLWVFGHGGSGIGGPGGFGIGGAAGSGRGTSQEQPRPTQRGSFDQANTLTVVMLGGDRVKDDRFYKILGENETRTLSDLKGLLRERQEAGLQGIQIAIYEDSVPENHMRVTSLKEWAQQHDLQVSFSFPKRDAP